MKNNEIFKFNLNDNVSILYLTDKILLERYLKISFNDVNCAFALLKSGLEMRAKAPYLFTDRDVMSSEIQTACNTL